MKSIKETGKVNFVQAIKNYWQGLFSFNGYSTVSGYWWAQLNLLIAILIQITILYAFFQAGAVLDYSGIIFVGQVISTAISLGLLIASLAVMFRRFHDIGFKIMPIIIWTLVFWGLVICFRAQKNLVFGMILCLMLVIQTYLCLCPSDRFARSKENMILRQKR